MKMANYHRGMDTATRATSAAHQPDRQIKLRCPQCGAIARMTRRALALGGLPTCSDGATYAEDPTRRVYVHRKETAATPA